MKNTRKFQSLASAAILLASLSACSTVGKVTDGVTGTAGKIAGAAKSTAGAATDVVTGDTATDDNAAATSNVVTGSNDKTRALASREAELNRRAAELDKREAQLAQASQGATPVAAGGNYGAGELLPPGANPGQCFTRLWVDPKYDTVTERILVQEPSERIEIIPAKYSDVKKKVVVKEASEKLVTVPAKYKTVKERVLVKAATKKLIQVEPTYETVTEQVLDKPAYTTWKKGTGPIQRIDETTGEIMCLVTVPASYKSVKKRVLKSPATTKVVEIPAVYNTIEKRVVATPATTRKVTVPAEYKTVTVTDEVSPPTERRVKIPGKYATVTKRNLVKDGSMEWREILCDTNMTRGRITQIQRALQSAGHNPGAIDGVVGDSTMRAVNSFQRSRKLPVDNYLNIATVRALGVSPQ